jgi:hypothetical protein
LTDTLKIYSVKVNDEFVDPAAISAGQRDMIQACLDRYLMHEHNNVLVYTAMRKYIGYAGLGTFANYRCYNTTISDAEFNSWFSKKMQDITSQAVNSMDAYSQNFSWRNNRITAVDSLHKLSFIDLK